MSEDGLPKGYMCATCCKLHLFSAWVYAHIHVELKHTCDNCGAIHKIRNLYATQVRKGRKNYREGVQTYDGEEWPHDEIR